MKKIIGVLAIVAAVGLMAPSASASCLPDKLFSTWDFTDGVYYYVNNFSGDLGGAVGALWQPGNRAVSNEGTYTIDNWLREYSAGVWYVSGALGDAGVNGCASTEMVLVMTEDGAANDEALFSVGSALEDPSKSAAYNYADLDFVAIPQARALNSARLGDNNVQMDLAIADPAAGFSSRDAISATDVISGINLYTIKSNTAPSNNVADWTPDRTVPYAGGETSVPGFVADCTDQATDTWVAAGIEFTGEYSTVLVSSAFAVECDPGLADPDDKFQLIQSKGKGQKKGKPFKK